ncbi:MAG: hypothetical protein LUE93_02275 [Bacteroides sp.]|nr:hypothetical protein [Bacteroides sp.]
MEKEVKRQCELLIFKLVELVEKGGHITVENAIHSMKKAGIIHWLKTEYGYFNAKLRKKYDRKITTELLGIYQFCSTEDHPGENNGYLFLISLLAQLLHDDDWV